MHIESSSCLILTWKADAEFRCSQDTLTSNTSRKLGGPQDHSRVQYFAIRAHRRLLYSWLWIITAKGFRLKLAKGRDVWGRVQEDSKHRASSCPLPMESWTSLNPPGNNSHGVLPSKAAHLSLGFQSVYWGSIT